MFHGTPSVKTRRRGFIGLALWLMAVMLPAMVMAETKPLKVGFVYLGTPGDSGWTRAHDEGRKGLEAHFGERVETTYIENVPEGPDATRVIRELVARGNRVIFTTSFGYMDPTLAVAREYPDVYFSHVTGYKRAPNMSTGSIRFYEGRYVEGVVAGLMTESNIIGYIAAFPIPEVIRGINSFARGLHSVNRDAQIKIVWANTWHDPVKEGDASRVLIAEGADILTNHTDGPTMLQVAEKAGVYGFGQAWDLHEYAPDAQLFASKNNWAPYYIEQVQRVLDGTWDTGAGPEYLAGDIWRGIGDEYLVITEFRNMPRDVVAKAGAVRDAIADGSLDIFAGPLYDNEGNPVLAAGEVLDDAALLEMDYYIEGIEGRVPQ